MAFMFGTSTFNCSSYSLTWLAPQNINRAYLREAEPFVISESAAECVVQVLHCLGCPTTAAGPRQCSEPLLLGSAAVTEEEEGVLPSQQRPAGVADLQWGLTPPSGFTPQPLCYKPDGAARQGDLRHRNNIAIFQCGLSGQEEAASLQAAKPLDGCSFGTFSCGRPVQQGLCLVIPAQHA